MDVAEEIRLGEERIYNAGSTDFPHHRADGGEEAAWDLSRFRKRARIEVTRCTSDTIDFDLVGVDTSVANALRRCLIAEVPTVAVKTAFILQNTSLVQDEVLAHRLAFVPIKFNPARLRWAKQGGPSTDLTTVVFKMSVKCSHKADAAEGELDPEKLYNNAHIYSSHLSWSPKGDQASWDGDAMPRVAFDDILIAKLRPGQEIELELHCNVGRGSDHAKYSPVATASYRLMPTIHLHKPIPPELCDKFAACFTKGVIEVKGEGEDKTVEVVNPRRDTVSREVLRHPEFKELVTLGRKREHFIFSIESTGPYAPEDLLPAAISEMQVRIKVVREAIARMEEKEEAT